MDHRLCYGTLYLALPKRDPNFGNSHVGIVHGQSDGQDVAHGKKGFKVCKGLGFRV